MPRRLSAHHVHNDRSTHDGPGGPADAPIRRWSAGYTLAHAGRQLRLGPIAFWVVVGTLVVMAGWGITTPPHFSLPGGVLTPPLPPQGQKQVRYQGPIPQPRGPD